MLQIPSYIFFKFFYVESYELIVKDRK